MRRVTGMRDRIVPPVQMAPGINHPRRARAAPCQSRGSGFAARSPGLVWAPAFPASSVRIPPGTMGRAAAGREAAQCIAVGAKKGSIWVWEGFFVLFFNPLCLQGQCCTSALKRLSFSRRW